MNVSEIISAILVISPFPTKIGRGPSIIIIIKRMNFKKGIRIASITIIV